MNYIEENNRIKSDFLSFFGSCGYALEPCVALNSKIDPSVFLIGSCTSVFKQRLLNNSVFDNGHMLAQTAINSKKFPDFSTQEISRFSSVFTNIGLLRTTDYLYDVVKDQYNFFTSVVGLNPDNISINAYYQDKDFVEILKHYKNVVISDNPECRNKFGQCGDFLLTGRNIRFHYNGNNICVLSVYVNGDKSLAVESSSTVQVLLMEKYALKNTMCVSVLNDFHKAENTSELKYYDCISAISELLYCGVRPNSSHMDGRILKKYIKALLQICGTLDKKINNYEDMISFYIDSKYPNHNLPVKNIVAEAFNKCR